MTCWNPMISPSEIMWRVCDVFVTCEIQEIKEKKVQITTFTKLQSMSDPCIINLTKLLGHLGKFLIFSRGIWFLKQNNFHLEDIISVSRWSRTLYLPIYSIGLFHVAKNGIVLSREIVRSLENWFLGRGRSTVCPSKSSRKSFHFMHSGV